MPRVLATSLTYNPIDYKYTKAWVDSLRRFVPGVDILIVDESPDQQAAARIQSLADGLPGVHVERLDEDNRVKAYNLGFTRAQEEGYDHVLFCDSDTIVLPGSVQSMVACMDAHPRAGIVSALTNTKNTAGWKHMTIGIPDGLVDIEAEEIDYSRLVAWWEALPKTFTPVFRDDVFMVDATFMLMRTSAIRDLAGFDPALQHISFAEDYAQRLVDKGWTWGVCKSAVVYHGQRGLGGNMDNGARDRDTAHMHAKLGDAAIARLNEKVRACIYWSGYEGLGPGPDDKGYYLSYNLAALRGEGPP